jgi:hypothetical protein
MSLYLAIVALHVLAVLGFSSALALEWASLRGLREASDLAHARDHLAAFARVRWLAGPSLGAILLTAIYLGSAWSLADAWLVVAVLSFLLIPVVGGLLTGRKMARLEREFAGAERLTSELTALVADPGLTVSLWLRVAVVAELVFLMEVKPPIVPAIAALVAALLVAGAASLPAFRARVTS